MNLSVFVFVFVFVFGHDKKSLFVFVFVFGGYFGIGATLIGKYGTIHLYPYLMCFS